MHRKIIVIMNQVKVCPNYICIRRLPSMYAIYDRMSSVSSQSCTWRACHQKRWKNNVERYWSVVQTFTGCAGLRRHACRHLRIALAWSSKRTVQLSDDTSNTTEPVYSPFLPRSISSVILFSSWERSWRRLGEQIFFLEHWHYQTEHANKMNMKWILHELRWKWYL